MCCPPKSKVTLQGAYAVGPLAASQATLLIVDPLVSITLGTQLFGEQLRTGPFYVSGAVVSLAVLGAGVVMLSIWAPPVMTAKELARPPDHVRPGEKVVPASAPPDHPPGWESQLKRDSSTSSRRRSRWP